MATLAFLLYPFGFVRFSIFFPFFSFLALCLFNLSFLFIRSFVKFLSALDGDAIHLVSFLRGIHLSPSFIQPLSLLSPYPRFNASLSFNSLPLWHSPTQRSLSVYFNVHNSSSLCSFCSLSPWFIVLHLYIVFLLSLSFLYYNICWFILWNLGLISFFLFFVVYF